MTRSNLIFTHGAVFSVGIAAATVANSLRQPDSAASLAAETLATRSQSTGGRLGTEPSAGNPRAAATKDGRALSKKDSAALQMQAVVRINDPFERQRALMDLIDTLGPSEFAAVADQFRELDHLGDSRGEYDLLLRGWAKADPLTALEYVNQHGNSRAGRSTILATWAGNDPAAAERWALDNHTGDGANPHLAAVIRGIAGQDLATASRLTQMLPYSRERGEAVDAMTRSLFVQGIDAALAFPGSISDENLRGSFVSAIASRLADKDPAKAASWIAAMGQGDAQNRAARTVGDALAKVDSKAAASWVQTLKPEARAEAARGVIPIMAQTDIAGTAQWVSGLAGTPNYDRVVEEFVWSCNTRAPEQSAAWIQGVSDPDQQRRLFHRMLGEWARQDAAAVKQWVASNEVPADVLRRFSR